LAVFQIQKPAPGRFRYWLPECLLRLRNGQSDQFQHSDQRRLF